MPIAAILALAPIAAQYGPVAVQAVGAIIGLVEKLIQDGRQTSTAQENAALQQTLAALNIADADFDLAFNGV